MNTQMTKPMTINEYAASLGISITTVRRRIHDGGLDARLEHGRYFIYGQNGVHSGDEANTQNGHVDTQIEQANDKEVSQQLQAVSPDRNDQQALIDQLTSERDYLRDQLDKQTQLLAASTAQNSNMMAQLNPPPQPSWFERIRQKFPVNSAKNDPDSETP